MRKRKIPLRMCVGCREMKPKKELIRVVRSPEGEITIDSRGKSPGRGAYLCRDNACFERAYKNKLLEKALNQKIEPEIYQRLIQEMKEDEGNRE
ncbi:MAG: YlxR family protein [Thermoanaerobacteraceae bacterium]|nr:YlxR family protein [Thermoanaerobacteraceae bacterium]